MKKKILLLTICAIVFVLTFVALAACNENKENLTVQYNDSHVVYTGDTLDSIKPYLTVTFTDKDGTSTVVTDYSLSGILQDETSHVVVAYGDLTQTITVNVLRGNRLSIEYDNEHVVYESDSLDSIKPYLTVIFTAVNDTVVAVTNYTIRGTLQEGTSILTITYEDIAETIAIAVSRIKDPTEGLEPTQGLDYSLNDDQKSYSVVGIGEATDRDVVIPSKYNNKPITAIVDQAFEGSDITSIAIPDSVITIGDFSFANCRSLTSIIIGSKVTTIGCYAFFECSSNLESITVSIGNNNYHSNGNCLIETASNTLILGCQNSIIPTDESVTSVGNYAFYGCSNLTSIIIPDSVTTIGERAFSSCSSLTSITIPNSVTSIGSYAFYKCSSLTNIVIPDSVKEIGNSAFSSCSSLTSVTIGNNVTSIGSCAFIDCSSLKRVYYTRDVASWCNICFDDYHANPLCNMSDLYIDNKLVTELVIPPTVTEIKSHAFVLCPSITRITIPDSVTTMGARAFRVFNSLTIYCEAESKPSTWDTVWNYNNCSVVWNCNNNNKDDNGYEYAIIDGIRYSLKDNVAIVIEQQLSITVANIPSKVTYCNEEYNVTSISENAFVARSNLIYVTIGRNVTSIGRNTFLNCSSLTNITIPDSVTTIDGNAFWNCSSLTTVYYTGTADDWVKIFIESYNTYLTNAKRYYYSEVEPELNSDGTDYDGNYWYYNDDHEIVVWTYNKEN